jgi:hypothetical protein
MSRDAMRSPRRIAAYVSANNERVLCGAPLSLYIREEGERKQVVRELERALNARAVFLKNGDALLVQPYGDAPRG